MVERVLVAIFENATAPTQAYVTRWGSDPCESSGFRSLLLSLSSCYYMCISCVGARGAYE
jgi:hypothetical protein